VFRDEGLLILQRALLQVFVLLEYIVPQPLLLHLSLVK
jgi:hypothetical protein